MSPQVRGEGRTEEGRAALTGLNLVYPGLLVFYVEVQRVECDASVCLQCVVSVCSVRYWCVYSVCCIFVCSV